MNRVFASVLFSICVSIGSTALADEAPAPATPRIVVEIGALRNAKGVVRCNLFASPDGFPKQPEKALMSAKAPSIANGRAVCTFENVKPGTYAVGYLHDENSNGKMDTNFLGIPTEGYGASNNARGSMGPPKWQDAKFTHDVQTTLRLRTEY
jgi:uncharacterized protein (DUF2141 family)